MGYFFSVDIDPTNDNAMGYASVVNNILNKFLSLKMQDGDSLEQRIGKLEISNTAFKSEPLFQRMPVLYTEVRSIDRRKNQNDLEFVELARWLNERLPQDMLRKLNDSLEPIRRSFAIVGKIYYMSTFMANMAVEIREEDPDVQIVQDYIDVIKEDVSSSADIVLNRTPLSGTKRRAEEPLVAYMNRPTANVNAVTSAETSALEDAVQPIGTMARNIATIPPDDDDDDIVITGFKRKKWNIMFSFGNGIRQMASRVAAAAGGSGAIRGGGASDIDYYIYYLCLANIYQLFNDYMTFESDENFDYDYYEAYVKVVLAAMRACTQNGQRNYKALVNLLFIEFPKGRWGPDMFPNEKFQDCVTIVANNNAAQCLGLISGDFSYLQSSVDLPSIEPMLAKVRSMVKSKSFEVRSQWLVSQLANELRSDYTPMYRISSPVIVRTGRNIRNVGNVNTMNTRELASVYGGKRTRKVTKARKPLRRHTRKQLQRR